MRDSLPLKYSFFAGLATVSNLLSQKMIFYFYHGRFNIYLAMLAGTLVGLLLKYILDKKYIFFYQTTSVKENTLKFILYSLMGLVTTFIFWVLELSFYFFWLWSGAKYLGAVVGLFFGYLTKYHLDKRFVFVKKEHLI